MPAAIKVVSAAESANADNISPGKECLPVQCKLTVGAPDDPFEREADEMADKIMRMPEQNFIQRKCSHCEEEEKIQQKTYASFVQRKCAHCEEEEKIQGKPARSFIQRKESAGTPVASDNANVQIKASSGRGNNMDATTLSFMENRFDTNFNDVKIHTNKEAIELNRELGAKAFTVGNDIYFNNQEYQPQSDHGKHLLAHELTHVVQQNGKIQRKTDAPGITGTLTKQQFIEVMKNTYGVEKIYTGTMEDQIKSMYLDPKDVATLPGWVSWDPDQKPQ
ncbi:MAG: DUF4157 domain-containing protein, partial [Chitinophagaceae bacterium]